MDSAIEWATLVINVGLLLAAIGATTVAWQQARRAVKSEVAAARSSALAQKARAAAVEAQRAAADALAEANDIAREAERADALKMARSVERHHVEWGASFDWDTGRWFLGNRGPDVARNVRITVTGSLIDRVLREEDEIPVDMGVAIDFPAQFQNGAGAPTVRWRADWSTDLGTAQSATGSWPN